MHWILTFELKNPQSTAFKARASYYWNGTWAYGTGTTEPDPYFDL